MNPFDNQTSIESFEEIRNATLSQKKAVEQAIKVISEVQSTKVYKLNLLFRRLKQQLLIEHQRKDFLKWILEKVTKKDFHTRRLREFDNLERAKRILQQGHSELEEIGLDDVWRFEVKNTQRVFIFASVPFYDVGGGQRSAQLARTFNSMGKQVYYIYAFPCSEKMFQIWQFRFQRTNTLKILKWNGSKSGFIREIWRFLNYLAHSLMATWIVQRQQVHIRYTNTLTIGTPRWDVFSIRKMCLSVIWRRPI